MILGILGHFLFRGLPSDDLTKFSEGAGDLGSSFFCDAEQAEH